MQSTEPTRGQNIKALFSNKKSRNVIIVTLTAVFVVFVISIAVVGKRSSGPAVPPSNVGASIEKVAMVQERQLGEMDPSYRMRFEEQNLAQADSAEKSGGSAMVRIADDIKPRSEIKSDGNDLRLARGPSSTAQAQQPQRVSAEAVSIHPAVAALISGMRPVSHQTHAALAPLPPIEAEVPAGENGLLAGDSVAEKEKPIGDIYYNAGDVAAASVVNTMNSDSPGVALAVVHTGKLAGSKLIGSYVSAAGGTGIVATYNKLSTADGRLFNIQAKALSEGEWSELLSTSTDHKYMNRFVIRPLAYFMKGMAQAIQTSVGVQNTSYNDTSKITTVNQSKATAAEQAKMAAGMVGESVIAEIEKPEKMTPTTIVEKNEVFALVFLDRVAQNNAI